MNNNVEQIKERLNIVDVISSYIKVEKSGANHKACCPFHNEKTPSFFISPDRGTFKCFGCGEGGDMFTFVEKYEGVDFKGSLKILAEQAGVELKKENPKLQDEKNRLYSILEKTTDFFKKNLEKDQEAQNYLKERGLSKKIIKDFRLGFATDSWNALSDYLKEAGFKDAEIEKAGLIKKKEKGNSYYDRFRSRIIFPLFDNSDRPIAYSGRFFEKKSDSKEVSTQSQAKYLNSPETPLFSKSKILYAYNVAKNSARKLDFFILVEGQIDLLMSHQAGYGNTVASSGTAFTEDQINLLKRFSNKLVLAFDADEAGFNSAIKSAKMALVNDMEVLLMKIPEGMDPADLILKDRELWKKSLKEAQHVIDFYLEKLIEEIPNKRKLGKEVQEKVLPFLNLIGSEIEKSNFIEAIAKRLNVPVKAIETELRKIKVELPENLKYEKNEMVDELIIRNEFSSDKNTKKNNIIRQLSALYWWQKNLEKHLIDLRDLEKELSEVLGVEVFEKIVNLPEKVKDEIIFEMEIFYQDEESDDIEMKEDLKRKVSELLNNLKISDLEEKSQLLLAEIKELRFQGKEELSQEKMQKFNNLLMEKDKLK